MLAILSLIALSYDWKLSDQINAVLYWFTVGESGRKVQQICVHSFSSHGEDNSLNTLIKEYCMKLCPLAHCVAVLWLCVETCSSDGLQSDISAVQWIISVKQFLCLSGLAASILRGAMLKGTEDAKQNKDSLHLFPTHHLTQWKDHNEVSLLLQSFRHPLCRCGLQGQKSTMESLCSYSAEWSLTRLLHGPTSGTGTQQALFPPQAAGTWYPVTLTPSRR